MPTGVSHERYGLRSDSITLTDHAWRLLSQTSPSLSDEKLLHSINGSRMDSTAGIITLT
jgi:hypothetical protein